MARLGTQRRLSRSRLRCERLEDRSLLSTASCQLVNGIIEANFGTDHDFIEVDRNSALQTIDVSINFQSYRFTASDCRSVQIDGMLGNDLLLLDVNLKLPTSLDAVIDGNSLSGFVGVNPNNGLAKAHQHEGSGYLHWVVNTWTFQTGWDFLPDATAPNAVSRATTGFFDPALGIVGLDSSALLDGHLLHLALESTSAGQVPLFDGTMMAHGMASLHAGPVADPHASDMVLHDGLINSPFQGVLHKPG